ncbi:hypothetical protein D3C72_634340 [compost metagenome]
MLSPITPNSILRGDPMLPTTAGPVFTPMPISMCGKPCATHTGRSSSTLAFMPRAARTALTAASSAGTGATLPHRAKMASPMYLSMQPC